MSQDQNKKDGSFRALIESSEKFKRLRKRCAVGIRLSLTGITNLVVNYEDTHLVNDFLNFSFLSKELYKSTIDIDAVELQSGSPGAGNSATYLDNLIYGTFKMLPADPNSPADIMGGASYDIDAQTGKRKRSSDGFVNRAEVRRGQAEDKLLIIRNIDQSLDFCSNEIGRIDTRSLWIFDNFRDPLVKRGCRLLLITNKRLILPFKIRTIEFEPVDEQDAQHLIDGFVDLYRSSGYAIDFSDTHKQQIVRKICGLTYTEAGDALAEALPSSVTSEGKKEIDSMRVTKKLREKINRNFMENAYGLTHLSSRPWQDYICPESSNFTYDVAKILRDFKEIEELNALRKQYTEQNKDDALLIKNIDAIQSRMPHVIVLYGKGGVGKSAFPIHFAGLLGFDVWDFNINACHSKWIGEGSERMREALKKILKTSHVVVRIDEYDRAIGASSASGQDMHSAHRQVESEFMNWLQNGQEDNLFVKSNIFLVLTTNHKDSITGPLLRSGRADLVIDIDNFDAKSMKETFMSAPRRMDNRGVVVAGFINQDEFVEAVKSLDIDRLSELASIKGFTVRDVDTLLKEMAAHNYYFKQNKLGIAWNTDNFVKVLENSEGSAKSDNTNELTLGDRYLFDNPTTSVKSDLQQTFDFIKDQDPQFDVERIKRQSFV